MFPTQELLEKPGLFVSLQSVVSNFCDIDALLSLCVVIPGGGGNAAEGGRRSHEESIFNLEQRVNHVIGLKHALEVSLFYRNIKGDFDHNQFCFSGSNPARPLYCGNHCRA